MESEQIGLHWPQFWRRMLLCVATLIIGTVAAILFRKEALTTDIVASACVILTIAIIVICYNRLLKNPDEFERRIESHAFLQAGLWAVIWFILMNTLTELGWSDGAQPSVYIAPGMILMYQVMTAQYTRRTYLPGKGNAPPRGV